MAAANSNVPFMVTPMSEQKWKYEKPGRMAPSLQQGRDIRARVRESGEAEVYVSPQGRDGDCLVLTLWYTMGLRPHTKQDGWGRVWGIAVERRLPGDELYRGVVVCPSAFQAEQAVWALYDAGWVIRGRSWVKPPSAPFTPSSTKADRERGQPSLEDTWARRSGLPPEQRGDVAPLCPTVLTPFLRPVQLDVTAATALGPAASLNQAHPAPPTSQHIGDIA